MLTRRRRWREALGEDVVLRMNSAWSPWAARVVSCKHLELDAREHCAVVRLVLVVGRSCMHKETCSLLAWMKRSQRNHAVPGNTELAGHGSGSGSRGRPARRHARKLKRGGRGHCAAVLVHCTDASGQAGGCLRANRENAQTTGQKTSGVARRKLRRRAQSGTGLITLVMSTPLG